MRRVSTITASFVLMISNASAEICGDRLLLGDVEGYRACRAANAGGEEGRAPRVRPAPRPSVRSEPSESELIRQAQAALDAGLKARSVYVAEREAVRSLVEDGASKALLKRLSTESVGRARAFVMERIADALGKPSADEVTQREFREYFKTAEEIVRTTLEQFGPTAVRENAKRLRQRLHDSFEAFFEEFREAAAEAMR